MVAPGELSYPSWCGADCPESGVSRAPPTREADTWAVPPRALAQSAARTVADLVTQEAAAAADRDRRGHGSDFRRRLSRSPWAQFAVRPLWRARCRDPSPRVEPVVGV